MQNKINLLDGFLVYPSLRDHPIKTATQWINGRRIDDNIGDLWRVHDKLYDLSAFMNKHPGGSMWLKVTRGTDITESFESSHINITSAKKFLNIYYVKPANSERLSPYTFREDGFYSKLRIRVLEKISSLSLEEKYFRCHKVLKLQNTLLSAFAFLMILSGWSGSHSLSFITGFVLFLNINCAHNFLHKKDCWRMYAWDLSLLSSYEWRIIHVISHHGFTNSLFDLELSLYEPIFDFRVYQKSKIQRCLPVILFLMFCHIFFFFIEVAKRMVMILQGKQNIRPENCICFVQLGILYLISENPFSVWLTIHATASLITGSIALISAHHHPDIHHAGDGPCRYSNDWGISQLDSVRDRKDINGGEFYCSY